VARGRLVGGLANTKAGTVAVVVAVVAGVALAATMVLRTTDALFTATTDNPSNSWTTGTVVLSDDDGGTALFSSGTDGTLTGGQVLTRCIVVRYDGSTTTPVSVRLYGSATGALAPYLNLTIDQGAGGGGSGSCTGFAVSSAGFFNGTLDSFTTATAGGYNNGVGPWTPATTGSTVSYRFTITVQGSAAAQGKSASGTFTWEARG
jgi:hypothetical protein